LNFILFNVSISISSIDDFNPWSWKSIESGRRKALEGNETHPHISQIVICMLARRYIAKRLNLSVSEL